MKKKFKMKKSRKCSIDSLLKKAKAKFFKSLFDSVNICLVKSTKKIPQYFITNITKEFNQSFLNKSIISFYNENNLLPSLDYILENNICKTNKIELFKQLVSYKIGELYCLYVESHRFQRDLNEVKNADGNRLGIIYEFVASNLCIYYRI